MQCQRDHIALFENHLVWKQVGEPSFIGSFSWISLSCVGGGNNNFFCPSKAITIRESIRSEKRRTAVVTNTTFFPDESNNEISTLQPLDSIADTQYKPDDEEIYNLLNLRRGEKNLEPHPQPLHDPPPLQGAP